MRAIGNKEREKIVTFLHPKTRRLDEQRALRALELHLERSVNRRKVISSSPSDQMIDLNLEDEIAQANLPIRVRNKNGKSEEMILPLRWVLYQNDWYFMPDRPPRRGRDGRPFRD